jgi:hypothetical protein
MENYGYYTFIKEPYGVFMKNYPSQGIALCFSGPERQNIVVYHGQPDLSFAITNERLALIMEHV